MSEELTMAEKLELTRTALPRGLVVGTSDIRVMRPVQMTESYGPFQSSDDVFESTNNPALAFDTDTAFYGDKIQTEPCPFGEIITFEESGTSKTGIRGGVVYAGDKVWNVAHRALNLGVSGTFKVWLEVLVTAIVEDDVLLPGIRTSTAPEWKQATGNYPNQDIPEAPSGTGKAIIAAGVLTIDGGKATFERADCGAITITHCPGSLSHIRI